GARTRRPATTTNAAAGVPGRRRAVRRSVFGRPPAKDGWPRTSRPPARTAPVGSALPRRRTRGAWPHRARSRDYDVSTVSISVHAAFSPPRHGWLYTSVARPTPSVLRRTL